VRVAVLGANRREMSIVSGRTTIADHGRVLPMSLLLKCSAAGSLALRATRVRVRLAPRECPVAAEQIQISRRREMFALKERRSSPPVSEHPRSGGPWCSPASSVGVAPRQLTRLTDRDAKGRRSNEGSGRHSLPLGPDRVRGASVASTMAASAGARRSEHLAGQRQARMEPAAQRRYGTVTNEREYHISRSSPARPTGASCLPVQRG
jgi:hypothetical protein